MPPEGTKRFQQMISELVGRTGRRDRQLPLVCLSGAGSGAVLDALDDSLKVPHATARVTGASDVRSLLSALRGGLTSPRYAARMPFPRFALFTWLLDQDLTGVGDDACPATLGVRIRARRRPAGQDGGAVQQPLSELGTLFGVPWSLLLSPVLRMVPAVVFRVVVSGRIPGICRPYRWFMRQPYLNPVWSRSFVDFALRLTTPDRAAEDPRQIERLMVHAFLEDLQDTHSRSPWWRLRGWRRTTFPVAVLSGVTPGDAGHTLLKLVAAVRQETGRPDPLLLICGSERSVAECAEMGTPVMLNALPERTAEQRYLRVDIPVLSGEEATDDRASVVAPKPPPLARTGLLVALCLALLAPATGWGAWALGFPGCEHVPFSGQVSLRGTPEGCIGYSDNDSYVFNEEQPGQENLRRAQRKIFAQNEDAQQRWEDGGRRRPYVTLVYLGSLTGRPVDRKEDAYPAEREELEGLVAAQRRGLQQSVSAQRAPLLRVVVANAAFQMKYATTVVDMIDSLAQEESDAPVIGVIGLVESRTYTAEALRKLNRAGLPTIAPTLSADRMDANSRLFLQVASPNKDQSRMMAAYARTVLHVSSAHVYATFGQTDEPQNDLYVTTLRRDLKRDLGKLLTTDEVWSGQALQDECGYSGMLVFAGRWSDFSDFVQSLGTTCGTNQPRHLVADDSVNRYMANESLRNGAPNGLPLTYVTKSALANCESLEARARAGDNVASAFLRTIRTEGLFTTRPCTQGGGPLGERVGLTYDGAQMWLQAVETLVGRARATDQPWDPDLITPVAVHAEVLLQNQIEPFYGVTGSAEFPPGSGEPVNKRISLLHVDDITAMATPATEVFHCGGIRSDDPGDCVVAGR